MFQLFKGKRNEKRSLKLPANLSKADRKRVQEVIDRAKKSDGVPRIAQQSISFDRMFTDGICRIGTNYYTKTIQFQDINYQLAQGYNGLTPKGNLTLVDDYGERNGKGKQFITLVTEAGNYFYLIIDRDEKGEETVHFLNLVDERDLFALMEEDEAAPEGE